MLERLKKLRLTPIIQYIWSRTSDFFKKGDMFLLTMCCICTCFGITLVASATKSYPSHTFVPIQIFAFILGLFSLLCADRSRREHYREPLEAAARL